MLMNCNPIALAFLFENSVFCDKYSIPLATPVCTQVRAGGRDERNPTVVPSLRHACYSESRQAGFGAG